MQNMQTNYTFKKYEEKLKHVYQCTREQKTNSIQIPSNLKMT